MRLCDECNVQNTDGDGWYNLRKNVLFLFFFSNFTLSLFLAL